MASVIRDDSAAAAHGRSPLMINHGVLIPEYPGSTNRRFMTLWLETSTGFASADYNLEFSLLMRYKSSTSTYYESIVGQ